MCKYKNYISLIVILLFFIIINFFSLLDLSPLIKDVNSNLFNIITINSVFGGFLFTSITFFVGVSNTKTVETFERIDYMEKIYNNLINGFMSSMISVLLCVFNIFIGPQLLKTDLISTNSFMVWIIQDIIPIMILSFLSHTIVNFVMAIKHIKLVITSIRRKIKMNAPSKESIEKTIREIK